MSAGTPQTLTLDRQIRAACVLEARARKPGNVHPFAAFDDVNFDDFVRSADVIAPIIARVRDAGIGRTILAAVQATRHAVGHNTNLGMILLLTPLAAAEHPGSLHDAIRPVLDQLNWEDAIHVYEAIRLAQPGGLGCADAQDVHSRPTLPLRECMRMAARRDLVAREYSTDFAIVLGVGMPQVAATADFTNRWETAVIRLQLTLMSRYPDTLIARKCGRDLANEAARRATGVLDAGWPATPRGDQRLWEFDKWLREDGHRRNPGTTADLVAASLFAAFREQRITLPKELS